MAQGGINVKYDPDNMELKDQHKSSDRPIVTEIKIRRLEWLGHVNKDG